MGIIGLQVSMCKSLRTVPGTLEAHHRDSQPRVLISITPGAFKNIDVWTPAQTHEIGTSQGGSLDISTFYDSLGDSNLQLERQPLH